MRECARLTQRSYDTWIHYYYYYSFCPYYLFIIFFFAKIWIKNVLSPSDRARFESGNSPEDRFVRARIRVRPAAASSLFGVAYEMRWPLIRILPCTINKNFFFISIKPLLLCYTVVAFEMFNRRRVVYTCARAHAKKIISYNTLHRRQSIICVRDLTNSYVVVFFFYISLHNLFDLITSLRLQWYKHCLRSIDAYRKKKHGTTNYTYLFISHNLIRITCILYTDTWISDVLRYALTHLIYMNTFDHFPFLTAFRSRSVFSRFTLIIKHGVIWNF